MKLVKIEKKHIASYVRRVEGEQDLSEFKNVRASNRIVDLQDCEIIEEIILVQKIYQRNPAESTESNYRTESQLYKKRALRILRSTDSSVITSPTHVS
jgi:hypothetical protein